MQGDVTLRKEATLHNRKEGLMDELYQFVNELYDKGTITHDQLLQATTLFEAIEEYTEDEYKQLDHLLDTLHDDVWYLKQLINKAMEAMANA